MSPSRGLGLTIAARIHAANESDRLQIMTALSPDGESLWPSEGKLLGRALSDAVRAHLPLFGLDKAAGLDIAPANVELVDLDGEADASLEIILHCTLRMRVPGDAFDSVDSMLRHPDLEEATTAAVKRAFQRRLARCRLEGIAELYIEPGCLDYD